MQQGPRQELSPRPHNQRGFNIVTEFSVAFPAGIATCPMLIGMGSANVGVKSHS